MSLASQISIVNLWTTSLSLQNKGRGHYVVSKKYLIVGLSLEGASFYSFLLSQYSCCRTNSMPYAQQHYPFENKEKFHSTFPADFVSEGIDQTRGWFYTMLVIATLLFDTAPWKNLIVSGLVLAA